MECDVHNCVAAASKAINRLLLIANIRYIAFFVIRPDKLNILLLEHALVLYLVNHDIIVQTSHSHSYSWLHTQNLQTKILKAVKAH